MLSTFYNPDHNEGDETVVCGQWSQQSEDGGDENSDPENPFPAKNFGHSTPGNLGHDVPVKERAQNVALCCCVPVEGSVLEESHKIWKV